MKEESILNALEEISRKLSLLDNIELALINEGSLVDGLRRALKEALKEIKKTIKTVLEDCHKEGLFSCNCSSSKK